MADADRRRRGDRTLGSRQLAAMLPAPAGARPAYRRLAREISALILDGRVALHVRLPAERELAAALGAGRATVTAAYDLLRERGFAHSRQGAGTWTDLPEGRRPHGVNRLLGPEARNLGPETRLLGADKRLLAPEDTEIDLARAAPGMPGAPIVEALAHVTPHLAEHARHTPGYHPYGLPGLRAAVAERFTRRGLATVPEQILVTSGAQHAFTLVTSLLCRPGDRVVVENPSYPNALDALRRARLRTVPVPVTDTGWDIGIVESAIGQSAPQLAYVIPDFHNPTGRLMPDEQRVRLLRAAGRAGAWLVVDETLADLALDVPAPPPLASLAPPGGAGQVITIGSMSKTHWAGLRIGWLRAPARLVTELAGQRVATDMGGSVLDQLLALALLDRAGDLLPSRLEGLRAQRAALADALAEHLPRWSWRQPPGGLALWADLGEPVGPALAERALDYGVRIEGGTCFATDPGIFEQRLRIPYTLPPDTLREAVRRLAAALADGAPSSATRRRHWIA